VAERLRILQVLGPSTGGIGGHVRTLAAELVRRGHEVAVCAPASTDGTFRWARTGAVFLPADIGTVRSAPGLPAWRALRAAAHGRDVVHAHGTRAAAAAGLARAHPLVTTWHNAPLGGRGVRDLHALLERIAARTADVSLGASEDLADRARAAGGADVRFAGVTAPPLPPDPRPAEVVRTELGAGERPVLLSVSRLAPQKRLDLLVTATAGWEHRADRPLVLVAGAGDPVLGGSLGAAATVAGSPLRLLGHRDDVAGLLAIADVLVLTSEWEARPLVVQEAMRAGVPVVATAVGGVPGLVGDAAVLVPPGDADALRAALERLLDDPAERRRLAQAGAARAATWPDVAAMVAELEDLYLDLRSRSRSSNA
jgi:glycosyltransferase involved in cell wall biosynthesis